MSTALQQLCARIEQATELGLLPDAWRQLARAAMAEHADQWESERVFRLRTGTSDKWCRAKFARCEAVGLARRDGRGRREWHVHARLPRANGRDVEAIKRQIVESFQGRAVS